MDISVILVAAGRGKRLGGVDKAFVKIKGREVILYSLNVFLSMSSVKEIIVVLNDSNINKARTLIKNEKVSFVLGGKTRAESVKNGVMASHFPFVLVHDAARPFIRKEFVERIVSSIGDADAVIPVLKVKPTVKYVEDGFVKETLNREKLVFVQTPQFFKKDALINAYKKVTLSGITDESMLIEKAGGRVKVTEGIEENLKITTPFDLIVLESIIKKWN